MWKLRTATFYRQIGKFPKYRALRNPYQQVYTIPWDLKAKDKVRNSVTNQI